MVQIFLSLILLYPFVLRAQGLDRPIAESLVSHTHVQAQCALLASSHAGVESARWPFYPAPSIHVESAKSTHANGGDQGAVLRPVDELMHISPTNGDLTIEVKINPVDIRASSRTILQYPIKLFQRLSA